MGKMTTRQTSADLPVFDEEVDLEPVSSLGTMLDQIRATGPVLFVRCSLREVEFSRCDLAHSLFDQCDLHLTDFGPGSYRRCDLRGEGPCPVLDQISGECC